VLLLIVSAECVGLVLVFTYSTLPNRALDEFARRRINADGAGAVDCVVCYDCLGEDVYKRKSKSVKSVYMFVMLFSVWFYLIEGIPGIITGALSVVIFCLRDMLSMASSS